ncbi:zinc-binding alcohol dehydrogenase family protein [Sporobolomyces salmoneus]|uniref:zinc-binding alcohol dehydrogenase family protein n=1 Tax=Sporobolomyces salmoneus TaxID=183962 RepID=UPI00317267E0
MKAVFVGKNVREIREYPIPSPDAGEILIKNVAISQDPKDWKLCEISDWENIEGNNVAGYVESVGEGVTKFKKGDKVAAFTKMVTDAKYGAYAEYTVSPSQTAFHVPEKTSFEEAAAFPLAYITAVIGLYLRLRLPEPGSPLPEDAKTICVYGCSSTVGVYVTQLAKKNGHKVVGVAGASIELAESYGADEVIDYRGKSADQLAEEISKADGGKIHYIYDATVEHGAFEASTKALGKNGGGRYTHVLPISEEQAKSLPEGVTAHLEMCDAAYKGPKEEQELCEKYFDLLGQWLEKGEFRPQRLEILPGGLEGVKEGLRRLKEGEVRGQKLVLRIADTPGLKA